VITGCVYAGTGEVYVRYGEDFRAAGVLLGKTIPPARATSAARPGQTQWLPADSSRSATATVWAPAREARPKGSWSSHCSETSPAGALVHREVTSTGCITLFTTYSPNAQSQIRPARVEKAVMEAGPDASIRDLVGKAVMLVQRWVTPGAVGLVVAISGMSAVPSAALTTPATLPLTAQWAHGYSGCIGVSAIGCQAGSRSVAALPSRSPLRIAVTGRQKL